MILLPALFVCSLLPSSLHCCYIYSLVRSLYRHPIFSPVFMPTNEAFLCSIVDFVICMFSRVFILALLLYLQLSQIFHSLLVLSSIILCFCYSISFLVFCVDLCTLFVQDKHAPMLVSSTCSRLQSSKLVEFGLLSFYFSLLFVFYLSQGSFSFT